MTHNHAPEIVNGKGPYTTPGVRGRWWTSGQWLSVMLELHGRRVSAPAYRRQTAHLDELARHPRVLTSSTVEDLVAIRAFITAPTNRPPRGQRGGTSWERVLVVLNNAIANHIHAEQLERDVREEQRELMEE